MEHVVRHSQEVTTTASPDEFLELVYNTTTRNERLAMVHEAFRVIYLGACLDEGLGSLSQRQEYWGLAHSTVEYNAAENSLYYVSDEGATARALPRDVRRTLRHMKDSVRKALPSTDPRSAKL